MNPSSKRVASRWLASSVDPKDEAKLVQAFLDDMKHGLHLAEMLDAHGLGKRFKRIQKAANAVFDIAATASPSLTISNFTPKWKDALRHFFREWNGALQRDYRLRWDLHLPLEEHTRKMHKVLTPMGIRPGQSANWFYDWAGRRKPSSKRVATRYRCGTGKGLELHLYDFDGTLFKSPHKPAWWGKKYWWRQPESLGPPCVPLKPGSSWWIGNSVRAAKKSIANPNVWAIMCTGRADTGSLRYRVAELLKQQGLNFDEVYLAKGGQDAPSTYKINVMSKILHRFPDIATVQIWEDTNLSKYVRYIESTGRICIPHPVKVPPHPVECTEEDMARMVEEGWSEWRKQP